MRARPVDATIDKTEVDRLIAELGLVSITTSQAEGKPLHHFVRGLLFSARLVDHVEEWVRNGHHAAWGQLVDDDGRFLSPENDLIIHQGKCEHTWKSRVMEFSIVRTRNAKAVIQCRAVVKGMDDELRTYCQDLKRFCPEVWLVSECCWAKTLGRCRQVAFDAKKAGYTHFTYLYDMTNKGDLNPNYAGWRELKEKVDRLTAPTIPHRRTRRRR